MLICVLLAIAVGTGVWTMQSHHEYFSEFTMRDLFRCRIDGWLYVLNILSTAWCVIDITLQLVWASEVGWSGISDKWQFLWMSQHAAAAVLASLIHVLTYRLLRREGFCSLCKREWGEGRAG